MWGREGLYGRPRPGPCAQLWGNALTPPAPGDHKGPPFPTSSTLAPTDQPASCLASRLSLMPIGRLLRAPWKRLCGWARQCKLQYGRIVCMCTAASVALSWAGDAPSSWFCCVWLSAASITLCRAAGRQSVRLLPAPVGIYRKPGERRFEPWSPPYSLRIACVTVRP